MNQIENELMHYGVLGMHWGKRKRSDPYLARKIRNHAGPGRSLTRKGQEKQNKKDLNILDNGGHLSVGLTKKRQENFDKQDREIIKNKTEIREATKGKSRKEAKSITKQINGKKELEKMNEWMKNEGLTEKQARRRIKGQRAVAAFIKSSSMY